MNLEQLAAELNVYRQYVWVVGATLQQSRAAVETIATTIPPATFTRRLCRYRLEYPNGSTVSTVSLMTLNDLRGRIAHLVLHLPDVHRLDVLDVSAPSRVIVDGRVAPLYLATAAELEASIHAERAERRSTDG